MTPATPFQTDPYLAHVGKIVLLQLKAPYAHPIAKKPEEITLGMTKEGPLAVIGLSCRLEELSTTHLKVSFTSPLDGGRVEAVMERDAVAYLSVHSGAPVIKTVGAGGIVLP